MKNKVVNAILGISAAASLGVSGYMLAENQTLANEMNNSKEALEIQKQKLAEDEKAASEAASKLAEINNEAKETQDYIDDLYERLDNTEFVQGYTIEPVDNMTMYTSQLVNVRIGPSTDYKMSEEIEKDQPVAIIGKVTTPEGKVWYVIQSEDEDVITPGDNDTDILSKNDDGTEKHHHMISASLLQDSKPVAKKKQSESKPAQQQSSQQQTVQPSCDCDNSCDCNCDCDNSCDCNCDCDNSPCEVGSCDIEDGQGGCHACDFQCHTSTRI